MGDEDEGEYVQAEAEVSSGDEEDSGDSKKSRRERREITFHVCSMCCRQRSDGVMRLLYSHPCSLIDENPVEEGEELCSPLSNFPGNASFKRYGMKHKHRSQYANKYGLPPYRVLHSLQPFRCSLFAEQAF